MLQNTSLPHYKGFVKGKKPIPLSTLGCALRLVYFCFLFCFSLFFFTPPRGTEQKSPTHCSNGPRPTFIFCFTPPRGTEQNCVFDALLKRSTTTMRPDKQNQTPLSEHNGPWPKRHVPRSSQGTSKKKGANSINNFFDPQLAKQKNKNSSHGI